VYSLLFIFSILVSVVLLTLHSLKLNTDFAVRIENSHIITHGYLPLDQDIPVNTHKHSTSYVCLVSNLYVKVSHRIK